MLKIRTLVGLIVFGLVFSVAFMADAKKTPDGMTPAEETVCDNAAHFGLCNAFCEAQDCDLEFPDLSNSCSQLLNNYQKKTDIAGPPCICQDVCRNDSETCRENCEGVDRPGACLEGCRTDFIACRLGCCEQSDFQDPECSSACRNPGSCGDFPRCNAGLCDPDVGFCLRTPFLDSPGRCQVSTPCDGLDTCRDDGGCPDGTVCTTQSCCTFANGNSRPVCVPESRFCPPTAQDADIVIIPQLQLQLGGQTTTGE